MTCCTGDRLGPLLEGLLAAVNSQLAECGVPVCRTFLSTAQQPPWDVCCACGDGVGQLWVSVDRVEPVLNAQNPAKCGNIWEASVWIGILRCALTMDDNGDIPDADALSTEALEILADRLAIVQALRCVWEVEPDDWTMGVYQTLGPMGGCLGGRQNITLRFADPKC
jgi:hypothetical protein